MDFKYILLMLLVPINYVVGELLQVSSASINMTRVIKGITGITITACYMECERNDRCQSIAITERAVNQLPVCYLLKKEEGNDKGGNSMTKLQKFGSGPTVNGQWGCWVKTSTCNATCGGGYLNETRRCNSPEPKNGGKNCTGSANRTVSCNRHSCPPVHGNWSLWRNGTECNVTCGGGTLNQTRKCDSPEPKHGGKDCEGISERIIDCNTHLCPVHGNWGAWKITSVCNHQCKGGPFTKVRECDSLAPEQGGDGCIGDKVISLLCSPSSCPVANIALNKPASQNGNPGTVSHGNDGNIGSYSKTAFAPDSWWQVDLKADFQIEYIIFRTDDNDFKVLGRSATSSKFLTCKDPLEVNSGVATFSCDTNHKFRWIKVEQKVQGRLFINEFEVYVKNE